MWVSLTWLASHTERIAFAPLVSPVSFRHPTMTARMASAVDDLSGGRLSLGLGAGWQEREHANYGWELLEVPERFDRFEEGLEVITQLFNSDEPVDFDGQYYRLQEAILLPRPARAGGPPILIGGNGFKRTLPLVVRYASEWNGVYLTPQAYRERSQHLDALLQEAGRDAKAVQRSLMTGLIYGTDSGSLRRKLSGQSSTVDELRKNGLAVGTGDSIVAQLGDWAEAGVQRIMLQWFNLDDLDELETLASVVLPQVTQ